MKIRTFVISGKVDMDTCGAGLLSGIRVAHRKYPLGIRINHAVLGIGPRDKILVVDAATLEQLADKNTICIECGGAGRFTENDWDHHEPNGPRESATMQVWREYGVLIPDEETNLEIVWFEFTERDDVQRLLEYIDTLDTQGPKALREISGETPKMPLSKVFSGMLLLVQDPVEQFRRGVDLLAQVLKQGIDPFGEMPELPEWQQYIFAKQENDRKIAEALKSACWETTRSGKTLGCLETPLIKAPSALYDKGAEIVVALNPEFGQPPIRKFTIAGNGIRVDAALSMLNALEPGWGGPATRTLIGSPRRGSKLSMETVVQIVKETL